MQQPWGLGRVLALITLILAAVLLFLTGFVAIGGAHLAQITLILLIALALAVVMIAGP
jgi:hypothetical protein